MHMAVDREKSEIASSQSLHLLSDADDHEENLGPSASKKFMVIYVSTNFAKLPN